MFLLAFVKPIKANHVPRSKAGPGKARLGLPGRLPTERTIPPIQPATASSSARPPTDRLPYLTVSVRPIGRFCQGTWSAKTSTQGLKIACH